MWKNYILIDTERKFSNFSVAAILEYRKRALKSFWSSFYAKNEKEDAPSHYYLAPVKNIAYEESF